MKTGILLIAHGAKESENSDSATLHSKRICDQTGYDVRLAYLHLKPGIDEAVHRMMNDGIERIVAVPLFISPGFLTDKVIRRSVGLEPGAPSGTVSHNGREAEIVFTGTFGDHQKMRTVMVQTCDRYNASPARTSVLLIFHGAKGAGENPYAKMNADYLRERGYRVSIAFNEFQEPGIEEGLEGLLDDGRDILAIPMFVSPGTHTVDDIPAKLGIGKKRGRDITRDGKRIRLEYAEEIGMHPDITYILKDRISEVL